MAVQLLCQIEMDMATFTVVYEVGMPRTIRFLLSMGFGQDVASDLAQGAWMRAWERLSQLRNESNILSWVNRIALNEARRNLRYAKRYVAFEGFHQQTTTLNVAAIDVAKVLERCQPEDREILEAQLDGTSGFEFAEKKGISETAMRLRNLRARRAARRLCEPSSSMGSHEELTDE